MWQRHRSQALEWIDEPIRPEHRRLYLKSLNLLGLIGRQLGGDFATLGLLSSLTPKPTSILDVGCGGGGLCLTLAKRFPETRILGVDLSAPAIELARQNKRLYEVQNRCTLPNLRFAHRGVPPLSPNHSFDVVMATLVCHHIPDAGLADFLRHLRVLCRRAVIVNDLHRHVLAWMLFHLISPLYRNPFIRHDGLLSIRRAFRKHELFQAFREAGFESQNISIRWHPFFRWTVLGGV